MTASFVRRTLESLSRRYGGQADLYRNTSQLVDNETGVTTYQRSVTRVRRMIKMPDDLTRKFAYDISYLAANKNFTYGGTIDQYDRIFLIPASQLSDFIPQVADWIVWDSKRYDVKFVEEFDHRAGYVLKAAAVEGNHLCQIFEFSIENDVSVEEAVTYEL